MFKIESYLSPFLLNWLNSYVKLKKEDFQLSLWEGDAAFNKLDLRLEVFQDLLGLPFTIRSGRIQELRIHVPWTKLGSEPICLTVNTIEFVLSLPNDDEKSSVSQKAAESLSTEFERNAEFVQQPPPQQRQHSYLEAMVFKILNNVQIIVNNLIIKYVEGDMIVSINVKSAETWSTDADWNKAFVDVLPPNYGLRKIANLSDATVCLDRCTPSGKIESYNEPFMYRCSLQCRMLFEYPSPFSRVPSSSKLAFFFGEPEFSLADTQLPLLLRLIRTSLTVVYDDKAEAIKERKHSTATVPSLDESGVLKQTSSVGNEENGWGNWAMSYLPGVVSWTTGFQPPIVLPPEFGSEGGAAIAALKPSFVFVGIYAKRVTFSLKLSKKHVDPLGTSSRIQFHPCLTVVCSDVKTELVWRGDSFLSCSVIFNSIVGKTAGFCTCHVRDEGEQVIACGPPSPSPPHILFEQVLSSTDDIPNNADEHLAKYTDEHIAEMQPAFMLDFVTDSDKSREKPNAPLEELRRFQRVIFRWFFFNPTISLTGGLFHRMTKFLGHAQKSEFDLFSSVQSEEVGKTASAAKAVQNPFDASSQEITSLDFNVCGRSDRIHIRNLTMLVAVNNHPSALPGKHSGIFAQRLSQIGSPLRLFAGNIIIAKTEPLFPKEIGYAIKAYTGPLTEEMILPCCAQSIVECSNLSLDLPSESGATFAIACGLLFSVTAKNYSALDTAILNSAGLPVDYMSFTMPDMSLTFNYPCLLYMSLVLSSYTAYDGRSVHAVQPNVSIISVPKVSSGLEVMTTALLGMIYANLQETFIFSTSNALLQKADFTNAHSSNVISCMSAVLSSVRLDLVASSGGKVVPIFAFMQSDVPSAALFVQWEPTKPSVHYILASFSSLTFNFSNHLNDILMSVDLSKFLESGKHFGIGADQQSVPGKTAAGGRLDLHHPQVQHQSAFRLLADLLASETVSTSKPRAPVEQSPITSIISALRGAVVNVHLGSIQFNILNQLTLKLPRTSASTPTGFKRIFTQQLFKLTEPLEVVQEETMLWTIRFEQISLSFGAHLIFNPPLTVWATLSAIQSAAHEETPSSDNHQSSSHKNAPSCLPLAQHQLSLHVNVETISLCLHRLDLRSLSCLHATLMQTINMVLAQMTILPSSEAQSDNTVQEYDETVSNANTHSSLQFWLQWTVPRLVFTFYLDEESSQERRLNLSLETGTLSIDSHPLYQKFRLKIQSLHAEAEQKKVDCQTGAVTWAQNTSYFFLTNIQPFEFQSYHLPTTPTTPEMVEDDSSPSVGDDFVISITTAKIRDVFLRIQEPVATEPVIARSTSGELFSPSLVGGPSASVVDTNIFQSGLSEICVSLPNVDVVLSREVVDLFVSLKASSTPTKPSTDEVTTPALYVNSGVVRTFFNLETPLTPAFSLDFLLLCYRVAITSDIEFASRSRRQTLVAPESSFTGGLNATMRSSNNGGAGHTCDNHMQISLAQMSAYVGTWSSLSRNSSSSFGRLSPNTMNNPALHWNLKAADLSTTGTTLSVINEHSAFFPILTTPIDVNLSLTRSSAEIIFKQAVDLKLVLNMTSSIVAWSFTMSTLGESNNNNSSNNETKPFEVTILCPALNLMVFSCQPNSTNMTSHARAIITRPQLVQHSSTETSLKISCLNFEMSDAEGASRIVRVAKDSANMFSPVVVFSQKSLSTTLVISEPLDIHLNATTLVAVADIYGAIQKMLAEIDVVIQHAFKSTVLPDAQIRTSIETGRVTLNYHKGEMTAQLSSNSFVCNILATNPALRCVWSHLTFRADRLLLFLLNGEMRYDYCILQPTDIDFAVDNRVFKIDDKVRIHDLAQFALLASATPVSVSLTDDAIVLLNELVEVLSVALNRIVSSSTQAGDNDVSAQSKRGDIFFVSRDDLRNEAVRYSFVSQSLVSACDSGTIPIAFSDPEQVFIATDGLLWSYNEPRSLTKLQLSPLPFTVQGDQQVICVLQRFDNNHSRFEPIISFRVPTEKSLSLPIEQTFFPSTCFRILLKQPIAPPIQETVTDSSSPDAVPPPATLAACCCVDSCFSSKLTPTMSAIVSVPKLELALAHCFPIVVSTASNCLPFPSQKPRVRFPPLRLIMAKLTEFGLKSIDIPDKGVSSDVRFTATVSCQNPRDLRYYDILDSAARINLISNQNTLALDLELHRLNLVVNEHFLRNLNNSINHFVSILNPESSTDLSATKFPFQIPITFLCNLTNTELVISDLDAKMPAPDIKVAQQQCAPFHYYSIHVSSKEWPVPLSLVDWPSSVDKKVIRVMPNESHAIVISKQTLSSEDSSTLTLLTVSSCLLIGNCLNASFSITYSGGSSAIVTAPLSVCSVPLDVKLRNEVLSIEISTADGFWVSTAPTKLRLKSGTFAFVSMKNAMAEGASVSHRPGHGRMFTVVVSLVVEKIETFFHAMLLILPPFVLENSFPLQVNAVLTNPHRGKVVCSLNETNCPYPFCDIFQDEMVHMSPSLVSQSDEEFPPQQTSPVTFSLESLSTVKDRAPGQIVPQQLLSVEKAIQLVANWLKSVTMRSTGASNVKNMVVSAGADIQIASSRLFPFAPTLSVRCVPGVRIVNQTSLPLVLLSTDGSALSLTPNTTVCAPSILAGIKLGFYDSNVLWQSKPIDVLMDVDKDDVFVVEDETVDNNETDYRDNYASDRITLTPNRSSRLGIVISSQKVECLLVISSKVETNQFANSKRESVVLTINSFLSAVNRSKFVSKIGCFSQILTDPTSMISFFAEYALKQDATLTEVPFVALSSSSSSTTTSESRYMDSIFISFTSTCAQNLRLSFSTVPFRYVTTICNDSFAASVAVSLSPFEEKNLRMKCLVIAINDNPFHDVTLRNMCDFSVYVREKPLLVDESGNVIDPLHSNYAFCISPGIAFELAFSSPAASTVQFGVAVSSSGEIVWSADVTLPSLLCTASATINSGGVNIVSFGHRSVCDLQITVDTYCDTIPQVIIKNLIKAFVAKQEKKTVLVQPAMRISPPPSSPKAESSLSRRSSSVSTRAQSPVGVTIQSSPLCHSRTQTLLCRFENIQVLFTDGELSAPRFVASLEGLTFGASMFATRGDGPREPTAGTFQASARRLQFDNYLEPGTKPIGFTFPVILLSAALSDSTQCFRLHGNLLSRLGETTITSLSFSPGSFSAFIEDVNMRDFVEYVLRISAIFERAESDANTVAIGGHPLPLRSFSIDACSCDVTVRASLYVYIAANQTPLNLSAFQLTASSLTWPQLIHRLTTFYVRGAIFRAGLLVGSLNIIGRPLSLVRTTTHAVRDICYSPFSGRGIIRTASTAARSVLADAILSVADFAESVGRNVGQLSSRANLTPAQQPESMLDGLKQGFTALGISIVGAIGGLAGRPMEEILAALESPEQAVEPTDQNAPSQGNGSLRSIARVSAAATRGVGLGIVGLVTQPMAGLSDFVAITGHGLLNTVGQPNMPRVTDLQPFFKRRDDFESIWFRIEDALVSLQFAGGHILALLRTETSNICLLLCRQTLSLFDLSERILQQTFFISDIEVFVDDQNEARSDIHVVKIYRRQSLSRSPGEDDSNVVEFDEMADFNKWRVEAYLASTAGPFAGENRSTTNSPPVYGLYSASLMEPKWRQKSRVASFPTQNVNNNTNNKTNLMCCVTIHESHNVDNVKRFLTIFYYLRDVYASSERKS